MLQEYLACADDAPCSGDIPDGSECEACMTRTDPGIAGMGTGLSAFSGLGYLGDVASSTKEASLWDIYTGKAAQMLEAQKSEVAELDARINNLRASWQAMPEGQPKQAASVKYQQANSAIIDIKTKLNPAIRAYNEIADWMRTYSLGAVSPARVGMASMGAIPVVIGAALVAIAIAEVLRVFSGWWQGGQAAINSSRGLIDQFAGAIEQGGGVIREAGNTALKVAGAAAIGVAIFLGYKYFMSRRKPATA